jgi:CheY-like chemotaxis protein
VSLGIVEQHCGAIRAENRPASEGGGARFVVSLPVGSAEAQSCERTLPEVSPVAARRTPGPLSIVRDQVAVVSRTPACTLRQPAGPSDRKPHVLIIDDEMPIRSALRRFFERRGWVVEEAADGAHGLQALMGRELDWFDVMVCDLKMPGMSGMELYSALASRRPELLARLIFATGDVVSGEAAAFLQQTRCPVLEKPYELSLLAATVDKVRSASGPLKAAVNL